MQHNARFLVRLGAASVNIPLLPSGRRRTCACSHIGRAHRVRRHFKAAAHFLVSMRERANTKQGKGAHNPAGHPAAIRSRQPTEQSGERTASLKLVRARAWRCTRRPSTPHHIGSRARLGRQTSTFEHERHHGRTMNPPVVFRAQPAMFVQRIQQLKTRAPRPCSALQCRAALPTAPGTRGKAEMEDGIRRQLGSAPGSPAQQAAGQRRARVQGA